MKSEKVQNYRLICFTDAGYELMDKLSDKLRMSMRCTSENEIANEEDSIHAWTKENFRQGNILIYIGAVGIAVRAIAPYVKDKTSDPGVVVIDEQGAFVIPILSGHLGGAVDAAREIASLIGAQPVITTATDRRGEFAVDVFASKNGMAISSMKKAKEFTAGLLKSGRGSFSIDKDYLDVVSVSKIADNIINEENADGPHFVISPKDSGSDEELRLIPRCIVAGIGCKKGKSYEEIRDFLDGTLDGMDIDIRAIRAITSIDLKKDEPSLIALSEKLRIPFLTYTANELMEQKGDFSSSDFALSVTGADNICERSLMAYGCSRLIMRKTAENGMTLALGAFNITLDGGQDTD